MNADDTSNTNDTNDTSNTSNTNDTSNTSNTDDTGGDKESGSTQSVGTVLCQAKWVSLAYW